MTARTDGVAQDLERALELVRAGLQLLADLERDAPAEVERARVAVLASLRAWAPAAVEATSDVPIFLRGNDRPGGGHG